MTSTETTTSSTSAVVTHVATWLPPTAPPPEPARPVNFLKALALYLLRPKTYGPHLAAASFKRALAAHVIALLFAGTVAAIAALCGKLNSKMIEEMTLAELLDLHQVRIRLAEFILNLAANSAGTSWSWVPALAVVGFIPLIECVALAEAVVVMPHAAGGDRASSVWKRSLKIAYWDTTIFIPMSPVAAVMYLGTTPLFEFFRFSNMELILILALGLLFAALGLLAVRATFVAGHRYVGPPDGPAFSPRQPRCDECGYLIIGLPLEVKCPECGAPVADSLPGGRRKPTAWQEHEFRPEGFRELLRMQWRVLVGADLFRRLPVHQGITTARHFWWMTYALMVVCLLGLVRAAYSVLPFEIDKGVWMAPAAIALLILPPVLLSAFMLAACLWAQFRYGFQDYRVSAVVCYYASPLMWPLMLAVFAALILNSESLRALLSEIEFTWPASLGLDAADGAGIILTGIGLLCLLFWWLRLTAALRAVRYANV